MRTTVFINTSMFLSRICILKTHALSSLPMNIEVMGFLWQCKRSDHSKKPRFFAVSFLPMYNGPKCTNRASHIKHQMIMRILSSYENTYLGVCIKCIDMFDKSHFPLYNFSILGGNAKSILQQVIPLIKLLV